VRHLEGFAGNIGLALDCNEDEERNDSINGSQNHHQPISKSWLFIAAIGFGISGWLAARLGASAYLDDHRGRAVLGGFCGSCLWAGAIGSLLLLILRLQNHG
jgi:hypothetical protein